MMLWPPLCRGQAHGYATRPASPPAGVHVKVIYRRGSGEIPAREIELHHAVKEDVEFLYHTQQQSVRGPRRPGNRGSVTPRGGEGGRASAAPRL